MSVKGNVTIQLSKHLKRKPISPIMNGNPESIHKSIHRRSIRVNIERDKIWRKYPSYSFAMSKNINREHTHRCNFKDKKKENTY